MASRTIAFDGPEGSVLGVVRCLDPGCASIETAEIAGGVEHTIAAGVDGPIALLRDQVSPGGAERPPQVVGLSLHVWDIDGATAIDDATEVELDAVTSFAQLGFGAHSLAVGADGAPAVVWIRTIFDGDPETAPPEAVAWAGWEAEDLDAMPPALLRDLGITADEGVFVDVFPGSAAAEAGLALGDVITGIDGTPVASADELYGIVDAMRPGTTVSVSYDRFGRVDTARLTLAAAYDELLFARCDDRSCASGSTAVLDATNPQGHTLWVSLALDTEDTPVFAYRASDRTATGDLTEEVVVARCRDRACLADARSVDEW